MSTTEPTLRLTCHGATEQVTGSAHLLEFGDRRVLLDCGLIQGSVQAQRNNYRDFPFDIDTLDAVVLSHAHIDHSGRLPLLVKRGYRGPVYAHPACVDLCRIMLTDAANLARNEAQREFRRNQRQGHAQPVAPLYEQADVEQLMRQFQAVPYAQTREILPGVELRLLDAGHILGAASVSIDTVNGKHRHRLLFSGDLGSWNSPLMRDPQTSRRADLVLMESTYGDRLHRRREDTITELGEIFRVGHDVGGNVLIPAFSVGRSQELLYWFWRHYEEWGLGNWKIYLDSPMAISVTEVYRKHANLLDENTLQLIQSVDDPHSLLPNLQMVRDVEQSMALNSVKKGAIIIAGSGMCTGGRIVHHLRHHIGRPETQVVIVGYQAQGTPGRRLVDGTGSLSLLGKRLPVRARIHTVGGLSAHADQKDLLRWYSALENRPPVCLVHGESRGREGLATKLREQYAVPVLLPSSGQVLPLPLMTAR